VLDLSSQDIYPLMQSILVSLAQICPGIEAVKSKRRCTYLQHLHLAPNHGREKDVVLKPVCGSIFFTTFSVLYLKITLTDIWSILWVHECSKMICPEKIESGDCVRIVSTCFNISSGRWSLHKFTIEQDWPFHPRLYCQFIDRPN